MTTTTRSKAVIAPLFSVTVREIMAKIVASAVMTIGRTRVLPPSIKIKCAFINRGRDRRYFDDELCEGVLRVRTRVDCDGMCNCAVVHDAVKPVPAIKRYLQYPVYRPEASFAVTRGGEPSERRHLSVDRSMGAIAVAAALSGRLASVSSRGLAIDRAHGGS